MTELNLTPILSSEGGKLPLDISLQIEPKREDVFSFSAPVHISGEAVNIGNSIMLSLHVDTMLRLLCDRCGAEVEQKLEFDCEERMEKGAPEQNGECDPDIIYFSGYTVDIEEIVYRNIYMNLPSKVLCQEDCKGLCPVCGHDLNESACECDKRTSDPRFDVLDGLLDS